MTPAFALEDKQAHLHRRALEALRRAGNPFRNYFARHPDDEVCARYHVPDLYAREREILLAVVDLYRFDPTMHSEVIPILGAKGAGKTHLLYSIKHGPSKGHQLLVTPGTFQKDVDFLEYLLFQVIDTLLAGSKQQGERPLVYISEEWTRQLLLQALQTTATVGDTRRQGRARRTWSLWKSLWGSGSDGDNLRWLAQVLSRPKRPPLPLLCREAGLDEQSIVVWLQEHLDRTEVRNTSGRLRRHLSDGLVRACLLQDEKVLADFLTNGFAELEYHVRPSRQELVLALFKTLMEALARLHVPVVIAFDQLEDLLLVRRTDDARKVSESFFAGLVQAMHQLDGLLFLIFAERGLWNRFIPSLDGYIQDRLLNPLHVPGLGTVKTVRLEPPGEELVRQVVAARLRPTLEELPDFTSLSPLFPFQDEQVSRIAHTEPTLRDMLQQFRKLFDHLVYGEASQEPYVIEERLRPAGAVRATTHEPSAGSAPESAPMAHQEAQTGEAPAVVIESVTLVHAPQPPSGIADLWAQEIHQARERLSPEGAITGATRELQAGLGTLLQTFMDHGVKANAWRLHHVVPEFTFGDHPTYGVISLAHWVCKDSPPWRLALGLFLGRGPGKLKDLQTKLTVFGLSPAVTDALVLLRPADDLNLSGKTRSLWDEAAQRGWPLRLEPLDLNELAILYAFPRWLAAVQESLPTGEALPNLAEFLQDRCDTLLHKISMPAVT